MIIGVFRCDLKIWPNNSLWCIYQILFYKVPTMFIEVLN
jgi:hypothetical protein